MATNRDDAQTLLGKLSAMADGTRGGSLKPEAGAGMAIAFALLDVADAVREQTARIEVLVTEA